ncbi:hypothetical protein MIMGU_mgv1a000817mg [Erythranthe guttata]|uniref:C2 NT-type domain-containing protein n=1 Tax=Erythranthe guttata TaxID=4155 RepID=A0A022QQ72_ERYGU|nr:hypothetical protein MIMGU_mgv1a000817mg [Erythranthe guttata]
MFKAGRWRSEKNKVKVVFKLQFHAAKVLQIGEDALMISVVPSDIGKPTVKSDKASVRDGSCFWENPVYETVKFSRDPKSGKIHERIYHFVVGTGLSKAGVIGEASIDFSNYAESNKVSLVSLPFKTSKTEAILHVSIQRMNESIDNREVEETENAKSNYKDHSLKAQLDNGDLDGTIKSNSDELPSNKTVAHIAELNGNRRASSGSDLTMSSSDSSCGIEIPWQPQMKNEITNQRLRSKSDAQTPLVHWESSTDDSSITPRGEAFFRQELEDQSSDIVIDKLKSDISALSRQAEMSELELQTLRKQIVKESKRGQDLFKELVCLKEERDSLKGECEKLRSKTKTNLPYEGGDSKTIVEELRQELNHAKELNSNLQIQLEFSQESNNELILAVRDLDELLEQKNRELSSGSSSTKAVNEKLQEHENDDDEEQKALEEIVKEHGDSKEAHLLERQIIDMRGEIEIYKRDRDEFEMQMEQLALDYEIMKQENHEMAYKLEQSQLQEQLKMQYECSSTYASAQELEMHIENLESELKRQSKESDDALAAISELEDRVKDLEEELEKQSQVFESDLETLMRSKIEQEQRAIRAEEALRKTRWQNADTAERLQMEFKRLSVQMASTFEANEKLATKSLAEANELRLQKNHLEEMLRGASEEQQLVKSHYEEEQMRISVQELDLLVKQGNDESIALEKKIMATNSEAEEWKRELNKMRCLVEEKELVVENLQLELDSLRLQCTELKQSLSENNLEKDKLRKQVLLLKGDLKKNEDALVKMEKKIKEGLKTSKPVSRALKEVANLKERIKLLEDQIKFKECALETLNNAFLEKEKDLHNKIGELEERLEEINQKSIDYSESEAEKAAALAEHRDQNFTLTKEARNNDEDSNSKDNESQEGLKGSANNNNSGEVDELTNEMELMKEKNKLMEEELKEMQERYSEISLKFAEVEGERQQLVMRVRNLKNAKKRDHNLPPPQACST